MQIKIDQPLARNSAAEPFDVRQLKGALNKLGYYQPFNKVGMTGMPDTALFDALIKFQSDSGLSPHGELRPDDDTVKAINQKLKEEPKDGYYIWRTVADDKVRSAHKVLNGTARKWSDSPDPTEDYNCRCWAEPVKKKEIPPVLNMTVGANDLITNPVFDGINSFGNHLTDILLLIPCKIWQVCAIFSMVFMVKKSKKY